MPKVTSGYLSFDHDGRPGGHPEHPIAPGGERPDNSLPGVDGPVDPGFGFPLPPVINGGPPGHVDNGLPGRPTYPVDPSYGLPLPPHVWPQPPHLPDNSLPVAPVLPTHPIYRPERPDQSLPLPPGAVWPPLPPSVTGEVLALVWIVGVGYRWAALDLDLKPEHPIYPPSTVPVPEPK